MKTKNRIFLIRHARTEENIKGIIQGNSIEGTISERDFILLDDWVVSIQKTISSSGLIISSDKLRSLKTAEVIKDKLNLPIIKSHYIRQRSWGSNEGKDVRQLGNSFAPDLYRGEPGKDLPYDAEYLISVRNRVRRFVEDLKENLLDKDPVIISHNEIISYIINEILRRNLFFHDSLPTEEGHVIGFDSLGRVSEVDLHSISPAFKDKKSIAVYVREDAKKFCEQRSVGLKILKNRGYKVIKSFSANYRAEAVIIGDKPFSKEHIISNCNLKIVSRLGSGIDAVDVAELIKKNIILTNTPVYNRSVAEFTISLILYFIRNIYSANLDVKNKNWKPLNFYWSNYSPPTVGIIGLGKIGKEVCRLLKNMDVFVIAWSRNSKSGKKFCDELGIFFCDNLDPILRESDVISLHLALNRETYEFLGLSQFKFMSKGKKPFLINTSRADIIDNNALLHALDSNWIKGATLDVWSDETKEKKDKTAEKLRIHDLVISTPHISGGGYLVGLLATCLAAYNIDWVLRSIPHLASVVPIKRK